MPDRPTPQSSPGSHAGRDWTAPLRSRLARLRLDPVREADIVEELSQHLDERYRELRASGTPEDEARRLALADLHEHDLLGEQMQPLRQAHVSPPLSSGAPATHLLSDLWHDLRYGARMLRKYPGFTAAVVATLALGIGANTALFSLVNATLLQRLPVADTASLVYAYRGGVGGAFSYPLYAYLRDTSHSFTGLAAWGGIAASLNADGKTDLVSGAIVTGNFFDVLGITAERGRLLAVSDDVTPGGHPVAVIGHDLWITRFGGRSDIIGQPMLLNGGVFTIVGVAPRGFSGPQLGIVRHLYVPMMMQALMRPPRAGYSGEQNPDLLKNAGNSWLFGLGRLRRGAAREEASAELATLATTFVRTVSPGAPPARVPVVPVDEGDSNQQGRMRSVAWLLGGVVGAVLLIACANIANLLLSRTAARTREVAVRLAIGASRARLVRQLLTESILLSLIGGAAGFALASAAVQAFQAAPPPPGALPLAIEFTIDQRVLVFSFLLSLVTGICFGVAPALTASRPNLVPALKDASANDGQRRRRFGFKQLLVVAQVALSLLLLITAALFVRSLASARAIDPGFDVEKLVSAPLSVNLLRYTRTQGRAFYRQIVARVETMPGVESASVSRVALMTGGGRVLSIFVEGRHATHDRAMGEGGGVVAGDPRRINANVVGPGFFRTLGIPLVAGRDFDAQDTEDRPPVVVMNETAARMHFPGIDPIGKRVSFEGQQGPWREIVGIVRDSRYGSLGEPALPVTYMPVAQNHETGMMLYVRASVPPSSLIGELRRQIQTLEPNLPVPDIRTMSETVGTSLYAARMGAWLLGVFGGLALLLAAVGIYGVLSFSVSRRTHEMGIRLALGADARDVFLLVVRDGMLLVTTGVVIGLASGVAGARAVTSFLYGAEASRWPTLVSVTTILVVVAIAACAIPARRAMRVNPITALRQE
jgi:macrolide transport system ATP-binding/permease protein